MPYLLTAVILKILCIKWLSNLVMPKIATAPPKNFESAVDELEKLVADLEGGNLPLADSLAAYKRGAELLKYAQGELAQVEQQVKILEGDTLKPFQPEL
jgi:exodeoxyribonuclease VII small subunit